VPVVVGMRLSSYHYGANRRVAEDRAHDSARANPLACRPPLAMQPVCRGRKDVVMQDRARAVR